MSVVKIYCTDFFWLSEKKRRKTSHNAANLRVVKKVSGQNGPRQNTPRQNIPKWQNVPGQNSSRQIVPDIYWNHCKHVITKHNLEVKLLNALLFIDMKKDYP